jgi:uncharacterized protein (TIGR03437 family)
MKKVPLALLGAILPLCLFFTVQPALMAQPVINAGGVVNAASGMAPALAGGGIARGSFFTIYGHGLGPQTAAQATSYPIETTLAGVSVTVSNASAQVNAYPFYAQDGQINAILPSNAPLGQVSVVVKYNNQSSGPQRINVVDASVGIFTVNSAGFGPAIFQNVNTSDDRPLNSTTATAKPGQIGVLWATGLGAIGAADNMTPPIGPLSTPLEIFVGDVRVTDVQYAGRAPGDAGVDYLQFVLPPTTPQGCYVPVQVRVKGSVASNVATIAVDPAGQPCSDVNNFLSHSYTTGGKVGEVALMRFALATPSSTTDQIVDVGSAFFRSLPGGPFVFAPLAANPPIGTCTVYTSGVNSAGLANSTAEGIGALAGIVPGILTGSGTALDAGSALTLTAATGTSSIPKQGDLYHATLGGSEWFNVSPATVLNPGTLTVSGPGGADVGTFTTTIASRNPLAWTNRTQITSVDQTQGITVNWSGADAASQVVAVAGVSTDKTAGLTGMFLCTAPAGVGSFTVPQQIVANLPPTRPGGTDTAGVLMVGQATSLAPSKFSAQGLDAGFGVFNYFSAKTVNYTQGPAPAAAPVISVTSSLDFGTVGIGQSKNLDVTVGNTGNVALTVTSLTIAKAGGTNSTFAVVTPSTPFTVSPGGQQIVNLQFSPAAAGSQTATLTIASNDPANPSATVALTGSGVANPNNPSPSITIVTPPAVTAGGPSFTVTVTGTGFVEQSVVRWNGTNKPTTFDSATQLHATISGGDIAIVTTGSISVVNPPPGGGTSNFLKVSVNGAGSGMTITQFDLSSCPLVNAFLTIADRNGNGVPGLTNVSVKCNEDGSPVYCDVNAASGAVPLSLALIIDTSSNTVTGGIAIEKAAANEFIGRLNADTSIALIQAGTTASLVQNFTPDKATLTDAVNNLPANLGGAALYDAIDMAIKKLQGQRGVQRRAIMVVTQDDNNAGVIQDSSVVLNEAVTAAIPVYSLTVSPGASIPSLVTFLNQLALNSFGTFYPDTPGVTPQFITDQIASILNATYKISYTTQTPSVAHTLGIVNGYSAGMGTTSRGYEGCVVKK